MLSIFQSKEKKRLKFQQEWIPLLEQAKHGIPNPLPTLAKKDARFFIESWNTLYEQANEEEKVGLAVFAYRVDVHRYAAGMLIDGNAEKRLSGIRILGYMRDESAWPVLTGLAQKLDTAVLPSILQSLILINSYRASVELAEIIKARDDWPIRETAALLKKHPEIDWSAALNPLPKSLSMASRQNLKQLLHLINNTDEQTKPAWMPRA